MVLTRKQPVRPWLMVLGSVALVLVFVFIFVMPLWWEFRLKRSLAEWRQSHSSQVAHKLIELLEKHHYGELGNKALAEIISPSLQIRRNYLAGRRVFASLESDSIINPGRLLSQYSIRVLVGNHIVHQYEAQGSLREGVVANFQFTNGLRSDGAIIALTESGDYRVVVILHVKLLPRPSPNGSGPVPAQGF